jgi:hypothetical protein
MMRSGFGVYLSFWHACTYRGGQKPRATRALALGVSRFFPYCSYCSTEGSSLAARFDPLLALGVGLPPVRHCVHTYEI